MFINTELYARVSVAVLFSKLADMAYLDKSTARNEDNLAVIASGKMFLLELLNSVVLYFSCALSYQAILKPICCLLLNV